MNKLLIALVLCTLSAPTTFGDSKPETKAPELPPRDISSGLAYAPPYLNRDKTDLADRSANSPNTAPPSEDDVADHQPQLDSRIAYGTEVSQEDYPFMAKLTIDRDQSCAGTLINHRVVLTAARCVTDKLSQEFIDPDQVTVSIGSGRRTKTHRVTNIVVPTTYMDHSYSDSFGDVALLLLSRPSYNRKISLASKTTSTASLKEFAVAGWGYTDEGHTSKTLQQAWVAATTKAECADLHQDYFYKAIAADHLCAGYEEYMYMHDHSWEDFDHNSGNGNNWDSNWTDEDDIDSGDDWDDFEKEDEFPGPCAGDAGGPLFIPGFEYDIPRFTKDVQLGVISFGPDVDDKNSCGGPHGVGFYTSVAYWNTWLQDMQSLYNMRGDSVPEALNNPLFNTCIDGDTVDAFYTSTAGKCCDACRNEADVNCWAWSWNKSTKLCSFMEEGYTTRRSKSCTSGFLY